MKKVTALEFRQALGSAQAKNTLISQMVHLYEYSEYTAMKCFLSSDNQSGFCIKSGNEIVSLFSTVKGRGKTLVCVAVDNGGSILDCFDGYLTNFYEAFGFKVYKKEKNWDKNGPDIMYMKKEV